MPVIFYNGVLCTDDSPGGISRKMNKNKNKIKRYGPSQIYRECPEFAGPPVRSNVGAGTPLAPEQATTTRGRGLDEDESSDDDDYGYIIGDHNDVVWLDQPGDSDDESKSSEDADQEQGGKDPGKEKAVQQQLGDYPIDWLKAVALVDERATTTGSSRFDEQMAKKPKDGEATKNSVPEPSGWDEDESSDDDDYGYIIGDHNDVVWLEKPEDDDAEKSEEDPKKEESDPIEWSTAYAGPPVRSKKGPSALATPYSSPASEFDDEIGDNEAGNSLTPERATTTGSSRFDGQMDKKPKDGEATEMSVPEPSELDEDESSDDDYGYIVGDYNDVVWLEKPKDECETTEEEDQAQVGNEPEKEEAVPVAPVQQKFGDPVEWLQAVVREEDPIETAILALDKKNHGSEFDDGDLEWIEGEEDCRLRAMEDPDEFDW